MESLRRGKTPEATAHVLALWHQFEDVPMNPYTEKMEQRFLNFPAGTPREAIWHWFDEQWPGGIYDLLYGCHTH